ncbi:MAG TPA: hypothetical protein VMJ10_19980 [Kofleriaceae bacterium]|nr:hypothetical protein [Kofleriaceae bacterium]
MIAVPPKPVALVAAAVAAVLLVVVFVALPLPHALVGDTELERHGGIVLVTATGGTVEVPGVGADEAAEVERIVAAGGIAFTEVADGGAERMPPGGSEDVWSDDEGLRYSASYVVAPTREEVDAELADWTPPPGTRLVYERISAESREMHDPRPGHGAKIRTYVVHTPPALDGSAISDARVDHDRYTDRPIVMVTFTSDGARRFGELTERIRGHKLAIVIGDWVISAPVIVSAIRGGRAQIAMGGSDPVEQERLATALSATLRAGIGVRPGDVREVHHVAPAPHVGRAWLVRLAIALAGGLAAFAAVWLAVRWIAPVRRPRRRLTGDAPVWPRVLWTIGVIVVMIAGWKVTLPGVDDTELAHVILKGGSGSFLGMFNMFDLTATRQVSVLALGTGPLLSAFPVVEIVALVVPRWRHLRHGGPEGRRKLGRAVAVLALVLAAVQGYFVATYLEAMSRGGADVVAPGWKTRSMIVVTLVAGTAVMAWLVSIIGQRGIGNGYAVVLLVIWLLDVPWFHLVQSGLPAVVALVSAASIALVAAAALGVRVGRIPLPSSGTSPFVEASSFVMLFVQLAALGVSLPWFFSLTHTLDSQLGITLTTLVAFAALWSFVFARPSLSGATAAEWRRATVASALVLVACELLAATARSAGDVGLANPVFVFVATATVLDLRDELRDRRRGLVPVWPLHAPLAVDRVRERLDAAGIAHHVQAVRLRTLLWFFGPHVPMMVLVPPDRAPDAGRILREIQPSAASAGP